MTWFYNTQPIDEETRQRILGVEQGDYAPLMDILIEKLLGEDWYVTDPMNGFQAHQVAAMEMIEKYGK